MALLLAMYQKMKLIRQINEDTLKLTRITSKIDRVEKNIKKTQERFTSLFAQIDKQAEMMKSNATVIFQNMSGLGMNNFANSINPYGFNGMNGFIMQKANQFLEQGPGMPYSYKDGDETITDYWKLKPGVLQTMWNHYNNHGGNFVPDTVKNEKDETVTAYRDPAETLYGIPTDKGGTAGDKIPVYENGAFTQEDVNLFKYALQQAQMAQQQTQMWVQNATTQYGSNVSIWQEAAKAQLEAQQDAAIEPLNYEDTMLQLEKEHLDTRLQRLRKEKESYDTLVGEEAENMAPTFGLR